MIWLLIFPCWDDLVFAARVTVEVFIKDQNDNAPFFKQSLYEVDVAEDQYFDTAFTFITAEDPDESKLSVFVNWL